MIKRLVCLLSAVMVAASSAFAWDAYSFTGVYDPLSIPNLVLADSSDSSDLIDLLSYKSWSISGQCSIGAEGYSSIAHDSIYMPFLLTDGSLVYWDAGPYQSFVGTCDLYSSIFTPHVLHIPLLDSALTGFTYNFSEPYPTSISLDCSLVSVLHVISPVDSWVSATSMYVRINDGSLHEYTASVGNNITISDIYTDYSGISSLTFYPVYENNFIYELDYPDNTSVDYNFLITLAYPGSFMKLGILSDNAALNGEIDEAQGNMNDLDSVESEWTGSMTSNFDALDLGNFSFPSGLVSGFALITGIFQDLWNSMGEYKILFVFPLTLGVVLLLIGRISKFSGGHSSRSSGRSDDA